MSSVTSATAASVATVRSDGWLRRIGIAVMRAHQIRRSRWALRALSDETLKDIGVARSEIDFVAQSLFDKPQARKA
jgi:uncharacterized protein YjiS (DUF1127 family)